MQMAGKAAAAGGTLVAVVSLAGNVAQLYFNDRAQERMEARSELRKDKAAASRAAQQATIDGFHANLLSCSVKLAACEARNSD